MINGQIEPSPTPVAFPETISEMLDRLDIPASKIGLNTAEQSIGLLHALDGVFIRLQELEPGSSSRKTADTQLAEIIAKLHNEAGRFIRDLGGLQALRQARVETNPPVDHIWWYLDTWLAEKRRAALKRSLITAGVVVVVFILLAVLYNRFLAPDPQVSARYGHLQTATDLMINGNNEGALQEVNLGLQTAPQDPYLLVLKGVVQEQLGQTAEAAQTFLAAEKGFSQKEEFLLTRGQDYRMANQFEKAMADAQAAIQQNPQSASGYLLRGQINEAQQNYQAAIDDYNLAFSAADKAGQSDLAAMARIYIAMLTQTMNAQMVPEPLVTPTPAP